MAFRIIDCISSYPSYDPTNLAFKKSIQFLPKSESLVLKNIFTWNLSNYILRHLIQQNLHLTNSQTPLLYFLFLSFYRFSSPKIIFLFISLILTFTQEDYLCATVFKESPISSSVNRAGNSKLRSAHIRFFYLWRKYLQIIV